MHKLVVIAAMVAALTLGDSIEQTSQGSRPPLEQCHPEVVLQRLDLAADGGLGNEQLFGSLGEAQIARSRFESLKERDLRQPIAFAWHS